MRVIMSNNRSLIPAMRNTPSIESFEALAFRRQQTAFCVLTLFVIAVLLLLNALFAPLLGEPSLPAILILGVIFLLKVFEIIWLQDKQDGISERTAQIETAISSAGIFIAAAAVAFTTNRDDSPYFVLLAIPILQCAYHCGLMPTLATVAAAIGMMFTWIQHYFHIHPPPRLSEYRETGMVALIFAITGPLVWYLVQQLKEKEFKLYEKMAELESAREKLFAEEKLAAVGRLASGIAHEIRNPVAMISSSLATAAYPAANSEEREEMFAIAAREAARLENLTGEFLTYARPSNPQRSSTSIDEIVRHIANVTRMRAAGRSIEVLYLSGGEIFAEIDANQVESALLNLSLNALDATPDGGRVELRSRANGTQLSVDVENSGKMIPKAQVDRVFEPFFTTKPDGTGLGLAIARQIAVSHGGDIWLSSNQDGAVVFTMAVSNHAPDETSKETDDGEGADS